MINKTNDWFAAQMNAPVGVTTSDFYANGITPDNTGLHDRDYYNLMQIAIKKRPHLILEVDVKDKDFYEELIYLAIEKDIDVFTDIADKYKTYDICITALNKNISCIDSVPPVMIDEKMTLMVLNSKREDLYEFIKNKKIVAKAQ